MPTLLHIDSSVNRQRSRTRELTAAFADAWRARGADHEVVVRDLGAAPLPHLADAALHWPERLRGGAPVPADAEALQTAVIDELLGADVVLLGAPMYNYSLPSTLKAWVDHIHVPGRTAPFDGADQQPLAGRPAVVVSARGASYDPGTPTADWDHELPALRLILEAALGMSVTELTVALTLSDSIPALADQRERAQNEYDAARSRLVELAAALG